MTFWGNIERRFQQARTQPATVRVPAWLADGLTGGLEGGLVDIAARIVGALDEDALVWPELPYHNRHHVAESVDAMDLLCGEAVRLGVLSAEMSALGIVAMVGHDLGHDGSLPESGRLERLAADRVTGLAEALGSDAVEVLRRVILATEPALVPANLARAAAAGAAEIDILCALANEADILTSLLPNFGWELAELLSDEWGVRAPARAAWVRSFQGRRGFLHIYAEPTAASRVLGVDLLVGRQIAAFDVDGAEALDAMEREVALARYRQRLAALPD